MTSKQINQLFVVGFGSSMVFGTVVGSFADRLWVCNSGFGPHYSYFVVLTRIKNSLLLCLNFSIWKHIGKQTLLASAAVSFSCSLKSRVNIACGDLVKFYIFVYRGRKFNCILYGVLYGVDCLSKVRRHWLGETNFIKDTLFTYLP